MITNSKQVWIHGAIVRVGFLKLRVLSLLDGGIYRLESLDGTKEYEFSPYNGIYRTN